MRLFVAINFTEQMKKSILSCQRELREQAAAGNFTKPENLHLTLAFIGEVRDPAAARRAVRSVVFDPFPLTLGKSGRFGNLYWLGAESGGLAERLAEALRDALRQEGVPFDTKPFKAHITLAREVELIPGGSGRLAVPEGSMTVGKISLMKSERIMGRLTYTEI